MPRFDVEALERFTVKTIYRGVEAPDKKTAEERCRHGLVPYDEHSVEEGDESWAETLSVEQCPPRHIFDDNLDPCLSDDCELPHCRLCGRHMIEHVSPLICEECERKGEGDLSDADLEAWNQAVQHS